LITNLISPIVPIIKRKQSAGFLLKENGSVKRLVKTRIIRINVANQAIKNRTTCFLVGLFVQFCFIMNIAFKQFSIFQLFKVGFLLELTTDKFVKGCFKFVKGFTGAMARDFNSIFIFNI
jgi:hypothetical protein